MAWITEPEDYSGAAGSTMPVVGSVSAPLHVVYGNGNTPFDNGDWLVITEPVTIGAVAISCESNALGTAFAVNNAIPLVSGMVIEHVVEWTSGLYLNHRMLSTDDESVQVTIFSDGSGTKVQVYQSGFTFDVTHPFAGTTGDRFESILSLTSSTVTVSYKVFRGGSEVYSNSETANFASLSVAKISCASFVSVNTYTYISAYLPINFTHKDNLGNIVNTEVSTDGTYNVPMLNMQVSNSGTHTLEADGLISTFDVAITEPVPPPTGTPPYTKDGDIRFFYDGTTAADMRLEGVDVIRDAGFETSVLISLLTDARAGVEDVLPHGGDDLRGWWADEFLESPFPSKLWLLSRSKMTPQVLADGKQYAEQALEWMIEDGIAESVEVLTARGENVNQMNFTITIYRSTGTTVFFKWFINWEEQIFGGLS